MMKYIILSFIISIMIGCSGRPSNILIPYFEGDENDPSKSLQKYQVSVENVKKLNLIGGKNFAIIMNGLQLNEYNVSYMDKILSINVCDECVDKNKIVSRGMAARISNDGYYLTARHVISENDKLSCVTIKNGIGIKEDIKIIYELDGLDIAILKADESEMSYFPVKFSGENNDMVFQVGMHGLSAGKIRKINKIKNGNEYITDIKIMQGDSGAGLFDEDGNLVGITCSGGVDIPFSWYKYSIFQMMNDDCDKFKSILER